MLCISIRIGHVTVQARRAVCAAGRTVAWSTCRALAAAGITATALSMSGCYSFVSHPVSQITPGALVSAEISETGRAALFPQIGSEIGHVQGQVVQQSDSTLQLRVSEVQFLSGLSSPWQGQEVTLRAQDMTSLQQRTYSKRRSVIAAIAIAGLIALTIAVTGFTGIFSGDSGPGKGTEPPPQT